MSAAATPASHAPLAPPPERINAVGTSAAPRAARTPHGATAKQRQHAGERDQGRLVTTTAASTRANAAPRSAQPLASQSQAKAAKTTSVMTSCAIFSCAAVYRP